MLMPRRRGKGKVEEVGVCFRGVAGLDGWGWDGCGWLDGWVGGRMGGWVQAIHVQVKTLAWCGGVCHLGAYACVEQ